MSDTHHGNVGRRQEAGLTTTGKKAELLARLMEKHGYGAKDQAKAKERHDKHVSD